ncbi:unnamed protein product [Rhizopus microsporus]
MSTMRKRCVITQNENGPCPLVAICNVLFLRGDLKIEPEDRELVSFEYLVERLGDYLLNHINEGETEERHQLEAALDIIPKLKTGLDVNILFDSIHGFETTPELSMFELFNVDLVHGWLVDPQDRETYKVIVEHCKNYNQAVECIVQGNELSSKNPLTQQEEEKLHQGLILTLHVTSNHSLAFIVNEFLRDTATQLTYYGLELLLAAIPEDSLCVLFRNNHFSTIYRHSEHGLLMLVTDSGFIKEESVVWESLGDTDQGSSQFFNGLFNRPALPREHEDIDLDHAIAMSLQHQERQQQQQQQQQQQRQQQETITVNDNVENKRKRKSQCVIS